MTFNMFYTKNNFGKIASSETRIIKQVSLMNKLNLDKCSYEFTPTETFLHVLFFSTLLTFYICRNDLNITKNNKLESAYIEIVSPTIIYCQQN